MFAVKVIINEVTQVTVMNDCLKVHWEVISPEMRPLHNELISCKLYILIITFNKMLT
jgi:hypothetical protein